MYHIYKDDLWGNKIPILVAGKPVADRVVRTRRDITQVVEVPSNVSTIIKL
jgi:hypothetical protein